MLGFANWFPHGTYRGDIRTEGDGLEVQTDQFIECLDEDFDLVMITERFAPFFTFTG
mgnify:CR=1 FL=1